MGRGGKEAQAHMHVYIYIHVCVCLWLIHTVWQKPTQHSKAIILKKKKKKKKLTKKLCPMDTLIFLLRSPVNPNIRIKTVGLSITLY